MGHSPSIPAEPITVQIDGRLDLDRLPTILERLEPILEPSEPLSFILDLRLVEYATPCGLGALRAAIQYLSENRLIGPDGGYVEPLDRGVARYMRRMDVFAGLVNFNEQEDFERHDPVRFAPMVTFDGEREAAIASRDLVRSIGLGYSERVNTHLRSAVVELAENVPLHSGATAGIAGAQGWLGSGWVEVVVVDRGRGLAQSLRDNPKYGDLSNEEALVRALDVRVSGLLDDRRGQGLWILSEIVKRNGGQIFVHSGDSYLRQTASNIETGRCNVLWPGTMVVLRLQTEQSMDISDLLNQYFPPENDYEFVEFK